MTVVIEGQEPPVAQDTNSFYSMDFSGQAPSEKKVIDLEASAPKVVPNVESVVMKTDYAMGPDSPGPEFIRTQFEAGSEGVVRAQASLVEEKKLKYTAMLEAQRLIASSAAIDPNTLIQLAQMSSQMFAQELDPRFILERQYSDRAVASGVTQKDDSKVVEKATEENPERAAETIHDGQRVLRRQQVAQRKQQEVHEELKNLSGMQIAGMFGLQLVPFWLQYNSYNLMGPNGSPFMGQDWRNQQLAYYSAKDDQTAEAMLQSALDKLPTPLDRATYLDFLTKGTTIEAMMGNLTTGADVAIFGAPLLKGADRIRKLRKATSDVAVEAGRPVTTVEAGMDAAGDLTSSGLNTALKKPQEKAAELGRGTQFEDLQGELTTLQNPAAVALNGGQRTMTNVPRKHMAEWISRNYDRLVKSLFQDSVDIPLATEKVYEAARANALEDLAAAQPALSRSVLNVAPANTDIMDVIHSVRSGVARTEADALMKEVVAGNKQQQWLDFSEAMRVFREISGRGPTTSANTWKSIIKKLRDDEDQLPRLQAAQAVIEGTTAGDRKLFNRLNAKLKEAEDFARPVERKPLTRINKDLGNTPMVGIGLGRSGDAATGLGGKINKILADEFEIAAKAGKTPQETVVIQLGNANDANLFGSEELAEYWAKNVYKIREYTIQQHGGGFFIEINKPVDFFSTTVQNALKAETQGKTIPQISNAMTYVMSPAHTLSMDAHADRLIAAFGTSKSEAAIKDALTAVSKLPTKLSPRKLWTKESREDFVGFLTEQRGKPNREDPKKPGRFSRDEAEFQQEYFDHTGRLPSENESRAYWAYVNLNDVEFAVTNMRMYSSKSRLGWQSHYIGKILPDIPLEGKFLRDGIPTLKEDAGVLVVDKTEANFEYLRTMGGGAKTRVGNQVKVPTREEQRNRLDRLYEQGYKVVQITEYAEVELRAAAEAAGMKMPEGEINFILTRNLESTPLPYQQIPYRPGGHPYYIAEHYISQPKIRRSEDYFDPSKTNTKYYGDHNVAGFETRAEASRLAQSFETARQMYIDMKKGGKTTASQFDDFASRNTPFSGEALRAQFDKGIEKGGFSLTEPFLVRGKNENLDKATKLSDRYSADGRYQRASDSELDMYKGFDLRYGLERDAPLNTIANKGSAEAPVFRWEPAEQLNPLATIQRTATDVIKGRYLEDLKFKTAQRFVAEFGDVLKPTQEELFANPIRFLFEAPFRDVSPGDAIGRTKMNAAMNFRRSALEFMNIQTQNEKDQKILRTLAMDFTFNRSEGGIASRTVAKVLDPMATNLDVNIGQKVKNAAYHGFFVFNPSQFFKQAQAIVGVTGSKLFNGDVGRIPALFINQSLFNFMNIFGDGEKTLAAASRWAETASMGTMRAGDFREAWEVMKKVGFDTVGYERGDMAAYDTATVLRSPWSKVVDAGGLPMRGGEKITRQSAWLGAYDEWRIRNVGKNLDEAALAEIIDRASLFMGDMSKASSSTYQQGMLGVMTSLLPFNIKLAETMTRGLIRGSDRLSRSEAAGMMLMNALMYGVPASMGAVLLGVPAVDIARQKALDMGYDPESYLAQLAFYGFVDTFLVKPILGEHSNFSARYGPGNSRFIWDFLYAQDASGNSAARFLAGASGTYMWDSLMAISPFTAYLWGSATGNKNVYEPGYEDMSRFLSQSIAGYNQAEKLVMAFYTGNHLTKNGNLVGPTTKTEALFRAVFGIDPERIADLPNMRQIERDTKALQAKNIPLIRQQMQLAIKSFADGNEAAGYKHERNMSSLMVASGFTMKERVDLFPRLIRGMEADVDEVSRRFALKSGDRLKAFYNRVLKPRENQ